MPTKEQLDLTIESLKEQNKISELSIWGNTKMIKVCYDELFDMQKDKNYGKTRNGTNAEGIGDNKAKTEIAPK